MNAKFKNIDFSEIIFFEVCFEDNYSIEYYAKCRGKNCIVTLPKHPTSWNFSIDFE